MRAIVLYSLFAVAVIATPIVIEIEGGKHLEKRQSNDVLADVVKALLAFGAFIWGGGIISKRAINYYFEKKAKLDEENRANNVKLNAVIKKLQSASGEERRRATDLLEIEDPPEYESLMDDVD